MMTMYMVRIENLDGEMSQLLLDNDKDFVNLINHIDKTKFEIHSVQTVQNYSTNIQEYCVTNKQLEVGK